jgi:molybdopterin/thiamine biosynthesis adenylyltransferase
VETDRYATLKRVAGWDQDRVHQMTAMVVGVGALGNEVAKNLALLGVGRIAIIDFDQVAISNLTHSVLFRASDHGKPKVYAAARSLRELNPDVRVLSLCADVTRQVGLGIFRRMDIVFGCVDSVAARYHLNRHCWRVGVPWVEGGIGGTAGHIGSVRVFQPPHSACYECTMSIADRTALSPKRVSCSDPLQLATRPSAPTTPLIASIMGGLMVQSALDLMRGEEIGGMGWLVNTTHGELGKVWYEKRPDCLSHDEHIDQAVVELSAGAAKLTLGEFLEIAAAYLGQQVRLELGRSVVTQLACPRCRQQEDVWLDRDDLVEERRLCPECGTLRQPQYVQSLGVEFAKLEQPLASFGIPPLAILEASNSQQDMFFELSNDVAETMCWI